ncbi:MAG: hypothetical protein ACLGHL_09395, partial [Actinomycetota bacterium]
GGIGSLVGLIRAFPQLIRLGLTGDPHGVSIDTTGTSSAISFGWASYGFLSDQLPVALATLSSGVVFLLITVMGVSLGRRMSEMKTAAVWAVVLLVVGAIWREEGLGILLPLSILVGNVPQLVTAYRESDLTGLSVGTWMFSVVDGLVWGAYSVVTGDRSIAAFGILQTTTSSLIVARRLAWGRRRRPAPSMAG